MVISGFQELKTQLREAAPQPAVVAAAHDVHTLEAVFQARRDGLISPILVGDVERIRSIARSQGEEIPQEALVQAGGEGECAQRSVDLIRQGRGKLLIKGMLQTGALLRRWSSRTRASGPRSCCPTWPFWTCPPTTS